MFAIIEAGGKQYKVEKGTTLEVEKLDFKDGDSITMDRVVLISDKANLKIGNPYIAGAGIVAKIIGQKKGEKLRIFKMKAKDHYQVTTGHRQKFTTIEITDIRETGSVETAPKEEKPVKKAAPKKTTTKKAKTV